MNGNYNSNKRKKAMQYRLVFFLLFFVLAFMIILGALYIFVPARDITNIDNVPGIVGNSEPSDSTGANAPVRPSGDTHDKYDDYSYTFSADLSAYEEYMNPKTDEYLFLVNVDNKLASDYIPGDLVDVVNTRDDGRNTQKMRACAEKALEALFIEAEKQGMTYVNPSSGYGLSVMSAYRSYSYQTELFNNKVAQLGSEEAASKIVQYPGASEHQSGLCCDMHNIPSADTSYESDDSAKWLAENCYKFGFILRYPKDKTDITGVSYEPWHFRFVGRYHASRIHELGLCLEEYMEYIKK